MKTIEMPAATSFPSADLRRLFATFPSGVVGICADVDGELVGMAASSFVVVSLEPALVAVCIQKTSTTWPRLMLAEHVGVSVLADPQHTVARQLAGPAHTRFNELETRTTPEGAVLVNDAAATMACTVYDTTPAGDHDIVLLEVQRFEHGDLIEPLVFHGSAFRRLA